MKEHRRSLLQVEILTQLDKKPAKTITELAERMDALRPSVSRSLRALKEQGLVYRNRQGWHLTEAGQTEASEAQAKLMEATEEIQKMIEHISKAWKRTEVLNGITRAMGNFAQMQEAFRVSSRMEGLIKSVGKLPPSPAIENAFKAMEDFLAPSVIESTARVLENAIRPLAEVQKHNATILSQLAASTRLAGIEDIVRQNNLLIASAVDDVLAIHQTWASKVVTRIQNSFDITWASTQLANVNQAFEQLISYQAEEVYLSSPQISPLLTERITVPTATVAHYTDSLRNLVDAEVEADVSPSPNQDFDESGDESLDLLLNELDHDFVEMRRGSWLALHNGGPDRLRHAGTSQRELIRQVLQILVPDIQLPEDSKQGPQIKARVRIALAISESDAAFIDAVAKAVYSTYGQLNKYTHHNMKHEESLIALLHTGEGLLRFILAKVNQDTTPCIRSDHFSG